MNILNKMILRVLYVLIICAFFTTFGYGEYYQYTDQNGKISYTDDLSKIPESQRASVKKFKSEDSEKKVDSDAKTDTKDEKKSLENSSDQKTDDLKALQTELNKIYSSLKKERAAIEAQAPKQGATNKEQKGYQLKVDALNAKINDYEKKLKAYNDQVDKLNSTNKTTTSEK